MSVGEKLSRLKLAMVQSVKRNVIVMLIMQKSGFNHQIQDGAVPFLTVNTPKKVSLSPKCAVNNEIFD